MAWIEKLMTQRASHQTSQIDASDAILKFLLQDIQFC